jgi:hypothetical protein
MDDRMLKCGGEAMRKQLVNQFEELSLADKAKWSQKDEEIAKYGDYMQAEKLNEQKIIRQQ